MTTQERRDAEETDLMDPSWADTAAEAELSLLIALGE